MRTCLRAKFRPELEELYGAAIALVFQYSLARYGVDVSISREDLGALVEASTVLAQPRTMERGEISHASRSRYEDPVFSPSSP
jgi:hypothetical protein